MGKMNKKYLYEEQVKEIVNRHSFFQEEDWEISYRSSVRSTKQTSSKSKDWSKLKNHTPTSK
jgi:hypothetical protein